jgi:hypothetical protein
MCYAIHFCFLLPLFSVRNYFFCQTTMFLLWRHKLYTSMQPLCVIVIEI